MISGHLKSQEIDTFYLHHPISKYDTVVYKRIIEYNKDTNLYHVQDYFENGQIQMQGTYSKFDRNVKESLWCNYRTNTKQGLYQEWFRNGQIKFIGNYKNGLRIGVSNRWAENGQKIEEDNWLNNQVHGSAKYWTEQGELQYDLIFKRGLNLNPKNVLIVYMTSGSGGYDKTKSGLTTAKNGICLAGSKIKSVGNSMKNTGGKFVGLFKRKKAEA